jgi:hypothetical protein
LPEEPTEKAPDDGSISDDARLLRRIPTNNVYVRPDGTTRPSSGSFKKGRDEALSVYIEPMLVERGLTYANALDGHGDRFLLVAVTAGFIRGLGLGIVADRDDDDGLRGQAHGGITGKLSETARDAMAETCEHLIWPTTSSY